MFRLLCVILYILQTIASTQSQYAQFMPAAKACVPGSVQLQCPANTVIVIRDAFYGVASIDGSCVYTSGDCIADAVSTAELSCKTDSLSCSPYFTRKKLTECNGHNASYIQVQYDCIPIALNETEKNYDICQSSVDITTDHGVIKSPGYPSQFQTTTVECIRAIHVPNNKQVRLWVTDLYIASSTDDSCPSNHLYVVDNVRTYKHCGSRRFIYPDLCASTIMIQYFVTTDYSFYRGLRLYFEIIDRVPTDICPNGTVTPVPGSTPSTTTSIYDTTTPIPIYAQLGIASPIISFQLCPGESYQFHCPANYEIAVRRDVYGYTDSNQCDKHKPTDCLSINSQSSICTRSCSFSFVGHAPSGECNNRTASYQYIEYQCIPTNTDLVSNISCPSDGSTIPIKMVTNGRFQSYGYPHIKNMNCSYNFKASSGYIMNFYALIISLSDEVIDHCQENKLVLIDKFDSKPVEFCAYQHNKHLFSSCSEEVNLIYTVTDDTQFLYGVQLYVETEHMPTDGRCGDPPTTTTGPTQSTTSFTTITATPFQNQTYMTALPEQEADICYYNYFSYSCPTGYTFVMLDAYYGTNKTQASNQCGFKQGDCTQEALSTLSTCRYDSGYCYVGYYSKYRLAQCFDNDADYIHIKYQCLPSRPTGPNPGIQVYNICDAGDIHDMHGILTSPNFPTFSTTTHQCVRKLVKVMDRVLKVWILELDIGSDAPVFLNNDFNADQHNFLESSPSLRDSCSNDYLQVNTPHGIQRYCGFRKLALAPICANSVDFYYNAASISSYYTGFKLYFEWIEKPAEITCGGDPITGSTTTPPDEPLPSWAQNLVLSPIFSAQICLGSSTTIRCPRGSDYVLSIIQSEYGVSGSGCVTPAWSHCTQTVSLDLPCTHQCYIDYILPESLSQCNSSHADYLHLYYECIPTVLPNNEEPIDICSSTGTETIATSSGIIVSPQYPTFTGPHSCSKRIQTLSNKLWQIFILDIYIDSSSEAGNCDTSSLTVYDGDRKLTLCGSHKPEYLAVSCSNIVEFHYTTSHATVNYRGFKMYFETMDIPFGWTCAPDGFTTTTTSTMPTPPPTTTQTPPSLRIAAYGGTTNGTRQYCTLPFTYKGKIENSCVKLDPPSSSNANEPWCSLTDNFDRDHQWGYCDLGVTDTTIYDICQSKSQALQCPSGYVIDILTADYAAKPDGSTDPSTCSYDQNDCFQSDITTEQSICAGLTSCTIYHTSMTLTSCDNRKSSYFHVDYTCIPKESTDIIRYDMCSTSSIQPNTVRGFIVTPNYPSTPTTSQYDCTFNLTIDKSHQDIYLYVVNMYLTSAQGTDKTCVADRLLITSDGVVNEMCGISYTNLLAYTCHKTIMLQFIRKAGAIGYGFQFYFEFRDKPPSQLCPSLPTTTTVATISPTIPTESTTTKKPGYFPAPSQPIFRTLCYPETSSTLDGKNFQCPEHYVMLIRRAVYGYHLGPHCYYDQGDCIVDANIVPQTCAGKQSCIIPFVNPIYSSECGSQQAKYLDAEYKCLPTPTIIQNTRELCNANLDSLGHYGILTSASYPAYKQTQCISTTLNISSTSNNVIHLYLLDMNIGPVNSATNNCTDDYLIISYQCNGQLNTEILCGTHSTELLINTCESTDSIVVSYALVNTNAQDQRGFALVYQLLPKSGEPTGGSTPTPIPTTTPEIPGPGLTSTNTTIVTKGALSSLILQCDAADYVLIIHKAELAVSQDETCQQTSSTCKYSPDDCFQDYTTSLNHCGGHRICHQFISPVVIRDCNSSLANYVYIEYQCIPTRPKVQLDICSAGTTWNKVEGGALLSTTDYKPTSQLCTAPLRSNKLMGSKLHKAFRIYIISLNLPRRSTLRNQGELCHDDDPFIDIDDHEVIPTRLCGYSHGRYVFETCSDFIEVRFNNTYIASSTIYSGFQIYFESINNNQCANRTVLPPPTDPYEIRQQVLCATNTEVADRADFSCTLYHGLVILQSQYIRRLNPDQCNADQYTCHYPSDQPERQCAGENSCSYAHVTSLEPEAKHCDGKAADALEFYYQCLPMNTNSGVTKFVFCDHMKTTGLSGFIDSKHYPNSYEGVTVQTCSLTIEVPEADRDKNYSIYLYIYELSIRDGSVFNSTNECADELIYTDGETTESTCASIDQPLLQFYTSQQQLNLTLNYSTLPSPQETNI